MRARYMCVGCMHVEISMLMHAHTEARTRQLVSSSIALICRLETESLAVLLGWPARRFLGSSPLRPKHPVLGLQACSHAQHLTWVLETGTQVLMLAQ